jgi:membrane protein YdbS with pleckstrin-like domain
MIEAEANEEVKTKGYRRLNRKCMLSMYITNGIIYAILLAAFILLMIFVPALREPGARPIVLLAAAAMVLLLLYFVIGPRIYYDRYRYMITADKVDVRYGIIILRHILVPIERVHQVEVSRGPVNNMLGLANVNITTAGGVATISYLELDEAEKIAERLNDLINRMLRDRE